MKISAKVFKPVWVRVRTTRGGVVNVRPMNVAGVGANELYQRTAYRRSLRLRGARRKRHPTCILYLSATDFLVVRGSAREIWAKIDDGIRAELERAASAGALIAGRSAKRVRRAA